MWAEEAAVVSGSTEKLKMIMGLGGAAAAPRIITVITVRFC